MCRAIRRPGRAGGGGRGLVAQRGGDRLLDLVLQRTAGNLPGHKRGDHVADLGQPPDRLGVPGHEQVEPAFGTVVDGGGPRGGLVEDLLGLSLGAGHGGLGLLVRVRHRALGLGPGGVPGLLRLGPGAGHRVLRLLLGGAQHPLGLALGLGPELVRLGLGLGALPVGVGLGVVAQLLDLFVRAVALRLGLVVGKLQDLANTLADLLVRRPAAGRLPGRGKFQPEPLVLIKGVGEPVFKVAGLADLVAGSRRKLVHLPSAVAAPLNLKFFRAQVSNAVGVFGHDVTRQMIQADATSRLRGRWGGGPSLRMCTVGGPSTAGVLPVAGRARRYAMTPMTLVLMAPSAQPKRLSIQLCLD